MSICIYNQSNKIFPHAYAEITISISAVFRYVLISKPVDWSDDLRQKFLDGFDVFLELLKCMQVGDFFCRMLWVSIFSLPVYFTWYCYVSLFQSRKK